MCTFNSWTVSDPDPDPQPLPLAIQTEQNVLNPAAAPFLANNRNAWRRLPYPYFVIFASGVICSLLAMVLLNGILPNSITRKTIMPHSLPDGHFLQVRDEFRVMKAPQDKHGMGDDQQMQMTKKNKKSSRGK